MSPRNNRVGESHGTFTVTKFHSIKGGRTQWECLCNVCGEVTVRDNRYFRKDRGVPTGCIKCKGKYHHLFKGYEEISKTYLEQIERNARLRGYDYRVTPEELWGLYIKQDRCCYLTGLPIGFTIPQTASLDRVDNSGGYEVSNLAWCHKDINIMKKDHSLEYFVYLCSLVKEPNVTELIE